MKDLEKFVKDFKKSGLTQKAYGHKCGMSNSMVWYYLDKYRKSKTKAPKSFQKLDVKTVPQISVERSYIRITTTQGVEIQVPI